MSKQVNNNTIDRPIDVWMRMWSDLSNGRAGLYKCTYTYQKEIIILLQPYLVKKSNRLLATAPSACQGSFSVLPTVCFRPRPRPGLGGIRNRQRELFALRLGSRSPPALAHAGQPPPDWRHPLLVPGWLACSPLTFRSPLTPYPPPAWTLNFK